MKTLTCCGPALLALALVACGGGESQRIVDACTEAISTKLADRSFELDPKDMLANVKPSGERQFELSSTVCFDCGLPSEKKQQVDCRAQFDPANPAAPPAVRSTDSPVPGGGR